MQLCLARAEVDLLGDPLAAQLHGYDGHLFGIFQCCQRFVLFAFFHQLGDQLGKDAATNVQRIRQTMRTVIEDYQPQTQVDTLQHILVGLAFDADVVRKIVLSFCVQGCYYTFTSYCGQMDEKRLVALLASIARAAQKIRM